MDYRAALDWLFSTQTFGIKLGLEGPRRLLREYLAFPAHGTKVIHVAGTNGKGSTCAMIDRIARSCGSRSGLFTSPHLIDYRERIRVSGTEIPEDACAAMLTELRAICEGLDPHPTFFEITLALGMRWFRERECDLIVLETGMGGRLDATTAVPADVCVITPVGLDHCQWLGDTLEQVALEKAGIIVEGKPVISAPQEAVVRSVLEKEANIRRSPIEFIEARLEGYAISLPGRHQQWNAAAAVSALHHAGFSLREETVRHGLGQVSWPGRFQQVGGRITIDGAHNPHAASVLRDTWEWKFPGVRPVMIFSAVESKDVRGVLEILAPLACRIILCRINSPRAIALEDLVSALPDDSPPHELAEDLPRALKLCETDTGPVLIAGSLFLVGEALAILQGKAFQASAQ